MYLYGTVVPEPGKNYAIHPYSLASGGSNVAVTVADGTEAQLRHWEGADTQKMGMGREGRLPWIYLPSIHSQLSWRLPGTQQ